MSLRKASIHLSEVTTIYTAKGKHERSNRWRLTTAVLGLALTVPVLVVATGFQRPASAETITVNETFELQKIIQTNPCAPYDAIQLNGLLHALVSTTPDGNGGFQVTFHTNTQGVTGDTIFNPLNPTPVVHYVASDEVYDRTFAATPPFPVSETLVTSSELISQGGVSQNWVLHITMRAKINALGVPEVFLDNMHAECRG